MSRLTDLQNAAYGNIGQKFLGTVGSLGSMVGAPELGFSELFGSAGAQNASAGYTTPRAVKKPDGGYDYFLGDTPVSLQTYSDNGGQVPADEPAIKQSSGNNDLQSLVDALNNQSGGSGTKLGSTNLTNPYTGERKTYNLDDPTQKTAFYNDKLGILQTMRDEAIGKARSKNDQTVQELNNELTKTYDEAKAYVEGYKKSVNEFGDQYQLGNVKRGQFFAGLSPNAFQSSQASSQDFAEKKYLTGLGDYAKEALGNVGNAFMANPNDVNALDANSVFGQNVGNIKKTQQDAVNSFNEYLTQANQNVYSQADTISNQLGGINEYGFSAKPTLGTAQKVDTSAYTPYTTFMQAGQQVPVGSGQTMSYSKPQFTSGTPLEQFLGNNQLSQKSKDYLKSYLQG